MYSDDTVIFYNFNTQKKCLLKLLETLTSSVIYIAGESESVKDPTRAHKRRQIAQTKEKGKGNL